MLLYYDLRYLKTKLRILQHQITLNCVFKSSKNVKHQLTVSFVVKLTIQVESFSCDKRVRDVNILNDFHTILNYIII